MGFQQGWGLPFACTHRARLLATARTTKLGLVHAVSAVAAIVTIARHAHAAPGRAMPGDMPYG